MKFEETPLPGSFLIQFSPIKDDRGFFARTFDSRTFRDHGLIDSFPQTNHSMCAQAGTIRGLHYQKPPAAEAKLFRCLFGRVQDLLVDVRKNSPTFLKWFALELQGGDFKAVYIPAGFAHGYQALTENAEVLYHSSVEYAPLLEGRIRFDDPRIGIHWPISQVILSPKDAATPFIDEAFSGVQI